VRWYR